MATGQSCLVHRVAELEQWGVCGLIEFRVIGVDFAHECILRVMICGNF